MIISVIITVIIFIEITCTVCTDHNLNLCEGGIVKSQVPWNVFVVEPILNSRTVAPMLVRAVVGVVDHVLGEELGHDVNL